MNTTPLEWSDLWKAMRAAPDTWHMTTSSMSEAMLAALPPAGVCRGSFLVGEASHHNDDGQPVYACFKHTGDVVEARYLTRLEFRTMSSIRS